MNIAFLIIQAIFQDNLHVIFTPLHLNFWI
jgi:hypothetical protein